MIPSPLILMFQLYSFSIHLSFKNSRICEFYSHSFLLLITFSVSSLSSFLSDHLSVFQAVSPILGSF